MKFISLIILCLLSLQLPADNLAEDKLQQETLKVPDGFIIEVFADNVKNARQMALGDKGTVFVGSRNEGKVYALIDTNKDGRADRQYVIDSDLNMPSGVAYKNGALYVAAVNKILRYDDIENKLEKPPAPVIVIENLPTDKHHGWKAIEFSKNGQLYVPVGVPCNICISDDERHGTILELNVDTGKYEIYAKGVRNSVGLAFNPEDNSLWFTDNGRDWLGDDLPPDEINRAHKKGLDFGFPYLHGKTLLDPEYGKSAQNENYTLPEIELGAHVAPLGLTFYRQGNFPEIYHNALFVAEHGSWNRSTKSGYRVVIIRLLDNTLHLETFVSGWLTTETQAVSGRPVDILQLTDGSLLISDDYANKIYRVRYAR